jgi:hypothetical protein
MKSGVQSLPPKMAAQFAERAQRMDGCVTIGTDVSPIYEWAQGSSVVTLIHTNPPMGHVGKDPRRADQIRAELARAVSP